MGVDIFGRKPKILLEGPEQIDFKSSTDDEKQEYWNKVEEWEAKNPGIYFRSNWWGWRPILMLCEMAKDKCRLKMNMEFWGSNYGKGLRTQKQCDLLADALELMLNNEIVFKEFMAGTTDGIQMVLGCWVETDTRRFYSDENTELYEQYAWGTILWEPVVTKKGVKVNPAHLCSLDHIKGWINFLRGCGGFKIW